MPCFKPLNAWQSHPGAQLSFSPGPGRKLQIPCSQCIGCRLDKAADWTTRCMHEASMWDDNCFITLTYDEENVPWDGSLNKSHFQKFMKRLRWSEKEKGIRFFHVGEYGSQLERPHYHALLFNHDFDDKELWKETEGICVWRSGKLEKLWPFGFATVGKLTRETAAYCARYATKKITGKQAKRHYEKIDPWTGEIHKIEPEYITMSLKPAIGRTWYETYKSDCYPKDFITFEGAKRRIPKYYDDLYKDDNEPEYRRIKEERIARAIENPNNHGQRLKIREKCTQKRFDKLKRTYEN